MIGKLVKLGLFLLAGILVYNYFFGTSEEKAQSKEVFKKTGAAIGSAWDLLKSEKSKFDSGKYDKVLEQLGAAYKSVRDQAKYVDEKVIKRLDDLEQRKASLEQQLDSIDMEERAIEDAPKPKKGLRSTATETNKAKAADQQRRKEKLQRQLDDLIHDTENLLKQAQEQ